MLQKARNAGHMHAEHGTADVSLAMFTFAALVLVLFMVRT
jgi:hypothetical protein